MKIKSFSKRPFEASHSTVLQDGATSVLPDDLLLEVTRRLDGSRDLVTASLVCKRWRQVHAPTLQALRTNALEAAATLPRPAALKLKPPGLGKAYGAGFDRTGALIAAPIRPLHAGLEVVDRYAPDVELLLEMLIAAVACVVLVPPMLVFGPLGGTLAASIHAVTYWRRHKKEKRNFIRNRDAVCNLALALDCENWATAERILRTLAASDIQPSHPRLNKERVRQTLSSAPISDVSFLERWADEDDARDPGRFLG